ncbi:MAG: type VI secretion system secreted protein Hcp [Granulosicoccus sp.]|jgi:type VI secretion system secreted protein Hcp
MAVDQFLKLTGIKGESQDDSKKDEIDVLAWSWGASQSGTTHMGAGGGAGKVSVQDLSITKYIDSASHMLLQRTFDGKHIDEGILTVRKAGGTPLEYLVITMKDIMVTSVSTGGSGGEDRLTENIVLNFGTVDYKYVPQKPDGSADADKLAGWDIAASKSTV